MSTDQANPLIQKHATLADVAQLAGVSTATVSRYLNAPDTVSEKMGARVAQAIQALSYAPNHSAKALAARKTNFIGAVIPTMDNAIFATGIQAFQESLSQAGYSLLISSSSYKPELEERQIHNLIARGVEALLLIGDDRDPQIYAMLKRRQIPYVLAWCYREPLAHCYVGFDNRKAARATARQVIMHGHKNIAIITGITAGNDRARDRLLGFLDAIKAQPLQIAADAILEAPYNFDAAGQAFAQIMRARPQTTALLCANDVLAIGALMQAQKSKIAVPKDLSIVGFDDIEISSIVTPKLSTMHVPHRKMGRYAAAQIINHLSTHAPMQSVLLEPHFMMRDSLGACPHSERQA